MNKVKAFTLIELLIVIAIIAILATIIIVSFSNSQVKARDSKRISDLTAVEKALDIYKLNYGSYPTDANCELTETTIDTYPECVNLKNALVTTAGLIGELPADPKPEANRFNYNYRYTGNGTRYSMRAVLEGAPLKPTAVYPYSTSGTCWSSALPNPGWYANAVYQHTSYCTTYLQKGRSN